jgi:hypothetical protein
MNAVLKGHRDKVLRALFSHDGARIATTSMDQTARLWDAATGRQIAVLTGHRSFVTSAAFSKDGSRIVTGSSDNTARVWDTETGWETALLDGHRDGVDSVAFSTDGRRVFTTAGNGTARIWEVFPTLQNLVDTAKAELPRCLTEKQREDAFLGPEIPDWCYDMAKWPYGPRRFGLVGRDVTGKDAAKPGVAERAGTVVNRVIDGLPAEAAGLRAGDIVLAVGGDPATAKMLRDLEITDNDAPVTLTILRKGAKREITMTPRY